MESRTAEGTGSGGTVSIKGRLADLGRLDRRCPVVARSLAPAVSGERGSRCGTKSRTVGVAVEADCARLCRQLNYTLSIKKHTGVCSQAIKGAGTF